MERTVCWEVELGILDVEIWHMIDVVFFPSFVS